MCAWSLVTEESRDNASVTSERLQERIVGFFFFMAPHRHACAGVWLETPRGRSTPLSRVVPGDSSSQLLSLGSPTPSCLRSASKRLCNDCSWTSCARPITAGARYSRRGDARREEASMAKPDRSRRMKLSGDGARPRRAGHSLAFFLFDNAAAGLDASTAGAATRFGGFGAPRLAMARGTIEVVVPKRLCSAAALTIRTRTLKASSRPFSSHSSNSTRAPTSSPRCPAIRMCV